MTYGPQSPFTDEHYRSIVAVSEMCRSMLVTKYSVSDSERKVIINVFERMAKMLECIFVGGDVVEGVEK